VRAKFLVIELYLLIVSFIVIDGTQSVIVIDIVIDIESRNRGMIWY
jgi:hypothetical protein